MKWLFRGVLLILLAFIGLCGVGYFLPASQTVERSIEVDAFAEDIFPYLNDLRNHEQWSALHENLTGAQIIYGGAETGMGQSMAWQGGSGDFASGSQEIVASQSGEFVQIDLNISGQPAKATYALLPSESSDNIIVLTKSEINFGGFPYLGRISGKMRQGEVSTEYDAALQRLKTIVESQAP